MKKLFFIAVLLTGAMACTKSDSFLDNKTSALDEQAVFSDSARTMGFLTRIYADMGYSFNKGRWSSHGNTEQATDDAEYAYSGVTQGAVVLYSGSISPINYAGGVLNDFWNTPWVDIRRVNLLLSKLPSTPLSSDMQKRVKGEARFLRAWFYHLLLINYGGVPLIGDNVYGIEDVINVPRASWAECVSYLVKELDEAGQLVPATNNDYNAVDYGRITKGACMGLKSRILLYAASPLFNGGSIATDPDVAKVVSYPAYDVKYWQAAADAAQDLINSGYYTLSLDNTTRPGFGFYNVFLQRVNPEYILGFYRANNKDIELFYNPPTRGGQKNSQPSQNLVDAFPMRNGRSITDPTSGYNPANPYVNRDPRFNYSIIFNESKYANSSGSQAQVLTYEGSGSDGFPATTTGYYSRKMCDSTVAQNSSGTTQRAWPLIRYAEILLNYAEAINETGQTQLAYPKLIDLRKRAGIDAGTDGMYGMKQNMTVQEMRNFIQNERRIELAFEDHRWNDIRRWKIAMVTNNAYNKVMRIVKNSNGTYTYNLQESVRRHNFRPEMYLLPIPNDEIRKMPAMVQNPGW